MAQRDTNTYKYSDSNKRYMTYDWYMKKRFGGKAAKVPLDIGCTCPNLDGTKGRGGCIYCKSGSRSSAGGTIAEQYENGVRTACRKWQPVGFIPYFQSNTNTYCDPEFLRGKLSEAASFDGALMLDVATRADCLGDDILAVLAECAREIPLTVELGLQTSNDRTAEVINRCHTFAEFTDGYRRLAAIADGVNKDFPSADDPPMKRFTLCVHIINGLPGESVGDMLATARDVAALHPDMVKIHLLHVLADTPLGETYERGGYTPMIREDYVSVVCDQLELLPQDTVIARLTGDGAAEDLLSPAWSRRKTEVVNEIDKEMYRRRSTQGCKNKDRCTGIEKSGFLA